jgi:ribonuclease R
VIRVIEHSVTRIVGTFEEIRNGYGFVIPDKGSLASDLYIPKGNTMEAVTGQKVLAEISDYGEFKRSPEGRIIRIIGDTDDPRTDDVSVVCALGLRTDFPDQVISNCDDVCGDGSIVGSSSAHELDDLFHIEKLSDVFGDSFEGKGKRLDLRDIVTFTIDGDDSGDFDDAVSLECLDEGDPAGAYVVGVHIADVSEYVREGSPLDVESLERGCSIYFPGRVIPMLPEKLSNGLCSLNPDEDRLSLSAIVLLGPDGKTLDHLITESVIRSSKRMTYSKVDKVLEGDKVSGYKAFTEVLYKMRDVSLILRDRRFKKGSVDFDVDESEISVDENGNVTEIRTREHSASRSLIEEFMLLANKTVAKQFCKKKIPFAYRIHEDPDPVKIEELIETFKKLGLSVDRKILKKVNGSGDDTVSSSDIASLMRNAEGTPFEMLIKTLTLRSMQRAEYKPECLGHYGLAFKYYCHFTSPIRRYPDLQIHRIIKDHIRGRMKKDKLEEYDRILFDVAAQSSRLERRAEEAEREVIKLKKCQYMASRIGNEYEGVISGVTEWGLYVELPNTVEGLVHISKLPGYYVYDEDNYELKPDGKGKTYALGQTVNVIVDSVDEAMRTIDFVIKE